MRLEDFVRRDQPPATGAQEQRQPRRRVRLQINSRAGELAVVESDDLSSFATKWSRAFWNRKRWAGAKSSTQQLNHESRQQLNDIGITDAQLSSIAAADIVEVSIPYTEEEVGRQARLVPWEYVINAALNSTGKLPPLPVVRHLRRERVAAAPRATAAAGSLKVLYVEAVPGALRDWDFSSERAGVISSLVPSEGGSEESKSPHDPDLDQLEKVVREYAPDVIHFAGFDTHHAAELMGRRATEPLLDGVVFKSRDQRLDREEVSAATLAVALNLADKAPRLVGFNLYNSATDTAALTVAGGALAAIGFKDIVDNELAELLFSNFYLAWRTSGNDPISALLQAIESLKSSSQSLTDSGMVLWRSESIVGAELGFKTDSARSPAKGAESFTWKPEEFPTVRDIFLYDDIKPLERLNYSLLHNNRGLFEKFVLKRAARVRGRILGLKLRVEIDAGGPSPAAYDQTFEMVDSVMPLHHLIRVPLVSELLRKLRHTLKTNMHVSIMLGEESVFDQTYSVDLLAVGEWVDSDSERRLLPSFVLPGDPVVPRIVDVAQRYLIALRDDAGTGFDGYQGLDEASDESYLMIDSQVRAIWTALQQDFAVKYINPPPTYTMDSQRVRTPSEIVEGRRGTCMDLTLLMLACLEYADIRPVIFLLKNHAFAGYWRSEKAHSEFIRGDGASAPAAGPVAIENSPAGAAAPWEFGDSWYDDIVRLIRAGILVPLETVELTRNKGFWEAVEQGNDKLHDRAEFQWMMDLWMARDGGVNELPILPECRA